jgi:class 3 adenylate cyclase/tetratricopeptide (TPR) repeat protein
MKCAKCQSENREDAKFCKGCGSKLEGVCPFCGAPCQSGDRFCDECGKNLRESTKTTPVDYSTPNSYTPKFLAEKILTSRSAMEGERKLVTVLFADVANFTAFSEKLEPEEIHEIMDGCFRILIDEIHKYEGNINQFTGDGVMALFGAPVAHEDHAQRACYAALAIQRAMRGYAEGLRKEYGIEFIMRIGLNSGPVIVGAIGDDLRMDYTAVGDTTNLASRMQSIAAPGGVLISEDTYRMVRDYFEVQPVGPFQVKGKEKLQRPFELLRAREVATRIRAAVERGLTPFVGRKNSMAALMEAYEKVKAGAGQVVGIVGEAGVGKSRLLLEFTQKLPNDEFTYLEGRCRHFGSAMLYLPLLDILRNYFGIKEGERELIIRKRMQGKVSQLDQKLQGILPPLQDLLSLKVEEESYMKLDPKGRRERVFEALRDLFLRESQKQALLIAIEDVHWIDKTSEEFLDYFIGWLANMKVMLVLLHRPEFVHRWGGKSYFNRIGLDQLTPQSSNELVEAILREGDTASEVKDIITTRAGGNPLFAEELTRSLLENGCIERKGNQYVLSRKPSNVPETIQGIIASRIDRLEESLKKVMQVASVIGREFAFRILQATSGMREELKRHLLSLQGLEFIYEKSLFPELEYIFKHALTQEVAYNSLLLKRRKGIHEKIGRAIEELYTDRVEELYEVLAYHYSRSDNMVKALEYLLRSTDKAMRNNSLWEALRSCKETLSVLKQIPDSKKSRKNRLSVILRMSSILRLLNFPEDPIEILMEGERLCKELNDKRRLATTYSFFAMYHNFKGNLPQASVYLDHYFQEEGNTSDLDTLCPLSLALMWNSLLEGQFIKLSKMSRKLIVLLEEAHSERESFGIPGNPYTIVHGYLGLSLASLGEFETAEGFCQRGAAFAQGLDHPFSIGLAQNLYALVLLLRGKGIQMIEHIQNAIENFEKSQGLLLLPGAWAALGYGYFLTGDAGRGLDYMEKGLRMQVDSGTLFNLPLYHLWLSSAYLELRDFGRATLHADKGIQTARKNGQRHYEGQCLMRLGMAKWKSKSFNFDEAQACVMEGTNIQREMGLRPLEAIGYLSLGELLADARQTEKCLEHLQRSAQMFEQMGMEYWLGRTQQVLASL